MYHHYSFNVLMENGAIRTLHANLLKKIVNQINTVGIIFEEESDFGKVHHYPISGDELQNSNNVLKSDKFA